MEKVRTLHEAREKTGVLIAAHRGMVAGNIPHNSIPAFEAALNQGADILETDVTLSGEGTPFIFHPRQEKHHLAEDVHIGQMPDDEIRQLRYINSCSAKTEWGLPTLDEFLEIYKNRCLINLDHAWDFFPVLVKAVRRHGMEDQILLKAPAKVEYAKVLEELAPDMMFMPIYKEEDTLTAQLEQMNINFVGAELVFAKDDSPLAQDDYIRSHKKAGRLLWCNAILYNCKKPLSGGHTDDVAVTGDPDSGWGWIVDKGFDIIQTDWVMPLKCYLQNR